MGEREGKKGGGGGGRAGGRALIGVVVHNVQDDLDAGGVQRAYQPLEFVRSRKRAATVGSKPSHRCEKVDMRVTPDVDHMVPRVGRPLHSSAGRVKLPLSARPLCRMQS